MHVALITSLNGIGLQTDAELLRDWLIARGHEADLIQYDQPWIGNQKYDLGISLEVIASSTLLQLAPRWWYFGNPEWLKPEYVRPIQRSYEKIFAKTKEAVTALQARFPKVYYVGFIARDKRDASIPRTPTFLHIGGNSGHRNTNAIIDAWRAYRYWNGIDGASGHLTVVSNSLTVSHPESNVPGVVFKKRVSDEEIKRLQNECLYHLYPSAYEGYGQALHEAQSVGVILLTTAAPPMDEFGAPFTVPSIRNKKNNLGTIHEVSPADIREAVPRMLTLPNHVIARMQAEARARFEKGNAEFDRLFSEHLRPAETTPARTTIAMLGNFRAEHSTENHLAWTLEDMGYRVIQFQEDEDTTEEILEGSRGCALLLYIHTHGWSTPGKLSLDDLLVALRRSGVKTASFHLDRYVGLNKGDGREDRVGTHPFWRTDTVFTADGGNGEFFKSRGVNHVWLPPGVIKRECYFGKEQKELAVDVGFVGAEGYHEEYGFRSELINFLRSVYGERFRLFQGFRGDALNNLYSSISVVVGDSCFGGADYYWSDRVPETLGRGGFLIHPASCGLCIPGIVTYIPGDLNDLQDKIDYYLEHPAERVSCKLAAQGWVKANETYHNRMASLLKTMEVA